jgi:ABC-type branched-chain amino acid transport system, permease component
MKSTLARQKPSFPRSLKEHLPLLILVAVLVLVPFFVAIVDGQPLAELLANKPGQAKFVQGLLIEVFILVIFALSYDLIFGVTGLLSFGHAMFFAVGAYATGIALKSLQWSFFPTLGLVLVAAIVQALLFSVVLPRVRGITFALVTLGFAEVFRIIVESREASQYTGANVGLQGIIPPEFLNPTDHRLRFYMLALAVTVLAYMACRRFVNSPTGRVCVAIRENEGRARMLGYNPFYFKLAALILSSLLASVAGMVHTLYKPIVSPGITGIGFTVNALLMVLVGGLGTLDGALVGAAVLRLLEYFLDKILGESAGVALGGVFIALVLLLPYGIVGTWRLRAWRLWEGWRDLLQRFTGRGAAGRR